MRGGGEHGGLAVELLLALLLGVVVFGAFAGVAVVSLQSALHLRGRAESLEAARTVWVVLDEELRPGEPGRDWWPTGDGEGVRLRAFRGIARPCGEEEVGSARRTVLFRGRRAPDPQRDSVLVLGEDGGWRAFHLERVESGSGCDPMPGEVVQRWSWDGAGSSPPLLLRLYESGSYHLADRALRYRRGTGARQPLTPEVFGGESSLSESASGLRVRLVFPGQGGGGIDREISWTLPLALP